MICDYALIIQALGIIIIVSRTGSLFVSCPRKSMLNDDVVC